MTLNGELLKIAAARIIKNSSMEKKAHPLVYAALSLLPMLIPLGQQIFKSDATRQQERTDRSLDLMTSQQQLQQLERERLNNINRWNVRGFYNPLSARNRQSAGPINSMFGVNMPDFSSLSNPSSAPSARRGEGMQSAGLPGKTMIGNLRFLSNFGTNRSDYGR